ncbi:hypothetical protein JW721_01335 [Candidatus Micrarchaeota archaeon]|nr:hypothetical protein [Candidatus Micrarchaeota archaeon]
MDSRILLFAVLAISLSCAMEIALEELTPGRVHYRVVERGASGSTLYLIAMLGETQYSVTPIEGFNGIAEGEIFLLDEGEYTITAKNLDTGSEASERIQIPQPRTLAQAQESSEELQEQFVEAQSTLPLSGDSPVLLLGAAVLLLVLLAALIIYANPFRQPSARGKRAKK